MATAPPLLSIEEYLHTSYSPDVDFVDGEIEERHFGEYEHARIQALVASFFERNEESWEVEIVVEQRIRTGSSRIRICDVAVLRADAPHEEVTATPPLVCIEILSPEDRLSRAQPRQPARSAETPANTQVRAKQTWRIHRLRSRKIEVDTTTTNSPAPPGFLI
jgi:Uma2 family endonuclease